MAKMPEVTWDKVPANLLRPTIPPMPPISAGFFGRDISPQVAKILKRRAAGLPEAMAAYGWVLETKPDMVVVWTDAYPNQRAMVMAGNELGIPTVELKHGQMHQYLWGHWETKQVAKWVFATHGYREFHRFYTGGGTVIPTGTPHLDKLCEVDIDRLRGDARKEFRIKEEQIAVCYLGTWLPKRSAWQDPGLSAKSFFAFCDALRKVRLLIPDLQIIFKKHPNDKASLAKWKEDFEFMELGTDLTIIDSPLEMAIAASDLVVGQQSSAMVDAMIFGVPCIAFDVRPTVDEWSFNQRGIRMVRDPEMLGNAMLEILMDEDKRIELMTGMAEGVKYFGGVPGATNRVTRALRRLLIGLEPDEGCWV